MTQVPTPRYPVAPVAPLPPARSASVEGNKNENDEEEHPDLVESLLSAPNALVARVMPKFGLGSLMGICTGYALKQASKVAMVLFGGAIIFLQSMQYVGYIEVKWDKIQGDLVKSLDSDGSGRIGVKDLRYYSRKIMRVLTHQGPTAGGFGLGVYVGFSM